jgi:hypothetical protein
MADMNLNALKTALKENKLNNPIKIRAGRGDTHF